MSLIRTAAVATVSLGLSVAAWPGPNECPCSVKEVPFYAAFIGIPNVDLDFGTGIQHVVFHGVGVAKGMDDVTCGSLDEKAYPFPTPDPRAGTPTYGLPTMMSGTYTITGDDGDSIVIWIYTPVEKYAFNQDTGHLDFAGTFTVIPGGTGRYRHATGSGTFAGSADAHPVPPGFPVNGHLALIGEGRWALWGTLSGVESASHCGH